jgi:hypothetical protein
MESAQIIEAARLAMATNTKNGERAAMSLLKTASDLSQATMIHAFEESQGRIIRAISKLTNKDLIRYNTHETFTKIDKLIDELKDRVRKEARSSVMSNLISGKIMARNRSGEGGLLGAFSLDGADGERVQKLVDQLCGNIFSAADATKESVHRQVMAACLRAQMSKNMDEKLLTDVTFPNIDGSKNNVVIQPVETKDVSKTMQSKLDTDPEAAAKEISKQAYNRIQFFRNRYLVGQREADTIRNSTLHSVGEVVKGMKSGRLINAQKELITMLVSKGLTAFTDKAGRAWSLSNYCNLTVRTNAKQSSNLGELFDDPEHDLYIVVSTHSNCPICSKYEGRVYSRSGKNPNYPPLSKAFGKIDKSGPDDITNTYLNIHPNCRHTLAKYVEHTKSQREVEEMKRKSNEPFNVDPRTKAQVEAYKELERVNALEQESIRRYREFMQYIPVKTLGTWISFHKHFRDKDNQYKALEKQYEEAKKKASK